MILKEKRGPVVYDQDYNINNFISSKTREWMKERWLNQAN